MNPLKLLKRKPVDDRLHIAVMWDHVLCHVALQTNWTRPGVLEDDCKWNPRAVSRVRDLVLEHGAVVHILVVRGPRLEAGTNEQIEKYLGVGVSGMVEVHFIGRNVEGMILGDRMAALRAFLVDRLLAEPVQCLVGGSAFHQDAALVTGTPYMTVRDFVDGLPVPRPGCTGFNDCIIHGCPGPHRRRGRGG